MTLYLLDTDLEENAPWDRELSARLYGGDRETRVQQEIVLGIGGVRALKALGSDPAGLSPQRRARRVRRPAAHPRSVREGLELRRSARRSAAHDGVHDAYAGRRPGTTRFRSTWWKRTWPARGAISAATASGSSRSATTTTAAARMFNMTALALRAAASVNGVSQLHGEVTKQMWQSIWPGTPYDALPVKFVTNGVHVPTWMSSEIERLLERLPRTRLARAPRRPGVVSIACSTIPDEKLWARAQALRIVPVQLRPRARAPAVEHAGGRARASSRPATMFDHEHADDRLRAALHRLQARRS